MILTLLTPDELTDTERESLWTQGVNLDDWDYLILAPVETISAHTRTDEYDGMTYEEWEQDAYIVERLLAGCCDNRWYKVIFRNAVQAMGIAYHG